MLSKQQMTPYVIDSRKRQEYFLFLIFFIIVSFSLGYFFGYQSGHSSQPELASSETNAEAEKLVEPEKEEANKDKPTADKAEKTDKKENNKSVTKTDKPQAKAKKETKKITKQAQNEPPKAKPQSRPKPEPKVVNKQPEKKVEKEKPIAQSKPEPVKSQPDKKEIPKPAKIKKPEKSVAAVEPKLEEPSTTAVVEPGKDTIDSATQTTEDEINLDQIEDDQIELTGITQYSVQVGMFSSKENASKFVQQLEEKSFAAYLVNFTASNGKEKYNVRLGPFADRPTAKEKMSSYKEFFTTPAYIVINK